MNAIETARPLPPPPGEPPAGGSDASKSCVHGLEEVYHAWFHQVCRWLAALGGPDTDIDDLAQEVFVVVRRKLEAFDGRHLRAWLYRITQLTLSDHRRRRWWRQRLRWRTDVELESVPSGQPAACDRIEQADRHRLLYRLLEQMNEKRREVLILFEIEGLTGEQIAELKQVPVGTVWTRLNEGRRELTKIAGRHRLREGAP